MGKGIDKSVFVVLAVFECKDCGRRWDDYKNAQACAAKHAKDYGHEVHGDVGISCIYKGRDN